MQVFLPFADYKKSVSVLDNKRLGNQIYRECLTLIRGGWPNHPVSKMWAKHKHSLAKYSLEGLEELKRRGREYPHHFLTFQKYLEQFEDTGKPSFVGDENFHSSHRAALLFKNLQHYSQFNWEELPKIEYIWPNV